MKLTYDINTNHYSLDGVELQPGDQLKLIQPDGTIFPTRIEFDKIHQDWFLFGAAQTHLMTAEFVGQGEYRK